MPATVLMLKGRRYLTSGQASALLGVGQRTILRWVERAGRSARCPEFFRELVWTRDPSNGFTYFREDKVLYLQSLLRDHRPRKREK